MRVREAMRSDVPVSPSNCEGQKQVFGCFLMADAEARDRARMFRSRWGLMARVGARLKGHGAAVPSGSPRAGALAAPSDARRRGPKGRGRAPATPWHDPGLPAA